MSTHEPGFQSFLAFLHHFLLAKLATSSIRVNSQVIVKSIKNPNVNLWRRYSLAGEGPDHSLDLAEALTRMSCMSVKLLSSESLNLRESVSGLELDADIPKSIRASWGL